MRPIDDARNARKAATTPIPVHSPNLSSLNLSYRTSPCQAWTQVQTRLPSRLQPHLWSCIRACSGSACPCQRHPRQAAIHYTTVYKVFARWSDDGSLEDPLLPVWGICRTTTTSICGVLHGDGTNTVAKKGGDGIGYSGYKHQAREKSSRSSITTAMCWSLPVAPVNEADTVLLPEGLKGLKRMPKLTGWCWKVRISSRWWVRFKRSQAIFNAGMIPNIKKISPSQTSQRGRKRLFNEAIHAYGSESSGRLRGDKFKRLLLLSSTSSSATTDEIDGVHLDQCERFCHA